MEERCAEGRHLWTRRRGGRECVDCGTREFGDMNEQRESARNCGCDLGSIDPITGKPHLCQGHRDQEFRAVTIEHYERPAHADVFVDVALTPKPIPRTTPLPTIATERKQYPIVSGVLSYFPLALMEVARVSYQGNEQHNPNQPLHWDRAKSTDQADCLVRHLLERGTLDTDGMRHSAKVAWRALALLQLELEAEGK